MLRILVVEDDETIRQLIKRHFGREFEIVETGDATHALALALERKPDCILLDLNLPKLSGLELCTIFSEFNATRLIPIIVMTGEPAAQYKEISQSLGAVDYIEKPLDFISLRSRLQAVLERKRSERRSEMRVRLSVSLKLAGSDPQGARFELLTKTEDVSTNGFACSSTASLQLNSIVEVWMMGGKNHRVGLARIVHVDHPETIRQRYGFQFTEKTGQWILQ